MTQQLGRSLVQLFAFVYLCLRLSNEAGCNAYVSTDNIPYRNSISVNSCCSIGSLTTSTLRSYTQRTRTLILHALQDQEKVDSITSEAEDAIRTANSAMDDPVRYVKPPTLPSKVSTAALTSQQQYQLISATFSGLIIGAVTSVVLQTQLEIDSIEPVVLTGILSIAFGAATFVVAKNPDESNLVAKSTRYFLGQPLLDTLSRIQNRITNSVEETTSKIKAIPTQIQQSVEQKIDDTRTTIQNIPSNVQKSIEQQIQQTQEAANKKVQETVSTIQQIPIQVVDAATNVADEIVTEIKATPERVKDAATDIAEEIVAEIKATPAKVQQKTIEIVQETVDTTKQSISAVVEDIAAIPSKIVASVEDTVNSGSGTMTNIPQPPKVPPPMTQQPPKVDTSSNPFVVEVPKIELPKVDIPKIELPKVDVPKINLPKVDISLPQQMSTTTPTRSSSTKNVQSDIKKKKEQEAAAMAATIAAKKRQQQLEQDQLEKQKMKLQQAKAAALKKEQAVAEKRSQSDQDAAKKKQLELQRIQQQQAVAKEQAAAAKRKQLEEQERQQKQLELQRAQQKQKEIAAAAEAKRRKEQEILQNAQDALQRSRELEQKRKVELENKRKQQEAAAAERMKQRQVAAEKQAAAQLQKQQATVAPGGSFRISSSKLSRAPKGVPTIIKWTQRKDGGISGRIYGSSNFKDGERVETSVIVSGTVDNGFVVKTDSGSRYFLSNDLPTTEPGQESAMKSLFSALPGATITLSKTAQDKAAQKILESKARKAEQATKPRPTFSLFGSVIPPPVDNNTEPSKTKISQNPVRTAPRGVPSIKRWRKNRDGSVTGVITGSSNFSDGEQVTTSAISSGTIASGEIVRTGSGSRYFLE